MIDMKIELRCEGNCSETMEIKRVDWGEDLDYYIEFHTSTFYSGQSVVGILKQRLKLAWLAVRKGNYIHQEILTNRKSLLELRDKLSVMLENK